MTIEARLEEWRQVTSPTEAEWQKVLALIADLGAAYREREKAENDYLLTHAGSQVPFNDLREMFPPMELQHWFYGELRKVLPEDKYFAFSRLMPLYKQIAWSNLVAWEREER